MYGRGYATAALVHCLTITAQFTAAFVHILVVVDTKSFLALGGLHKDKLCDILQQWHVETVHHASLFHIESNLDATSLSSMITCIFLSPN